MQSEHVDEGHSTHAEFRSAIKNLPSGKATRDGDIPVECFKALVERPGAALKPLLDLFNECMDHQAVSREWLAARIVMDDLQEG